MKQYLKQLITYHSNFNLYIGSLAVIMSVVPWDKLDPAESPYVKLFGLIGIPFAAGIINFVVLTAAASSCNSGIFANSRTMFGLAGRNQGPPFYIKQTKMAFLTMQF